MKYGGARKAAARPAGNAVRGCLISINTGEGNLQLKPTASLGYCACYGRGTETAWWAG